MICFFNNFHNGDFITQLMLIRNIKNIYPDLELACCAFKDHIYMIDKNICKPILLNDYNISGDGKGLPHVFLSKINSLNFIPMYTWLGLYNDTHDHSWENVIKVYNRECKKLNLEYIIPDISKTEPFYNFPIQKEIPIFNYKNQIFYDNASPRSGHSLYEWDDVEIFEMFPNLTFLITQKIHKLLPNVIDISGMNLCELSHISKYCNFIFGRGSGPFLCTFNEANMRKKRYLLNFKNLVPKAKSTEWSFIYDKIDITNINNKNNLIDILVNINISLNT